MRKICLIIEVHQPMRLRTYRFSEIGNNNYYYDDYENEFYTRTISEKCYIPANKILLDLIHKFRKKLKVSYLFSGVVLDQFELYAPEAIESFKSLISTGCVKLLSGSYSNSFGFPGWNKEFNKQVTLQNTRIKYLFRKNSVVFPEKDVFNSNPTDPEVRLYIGNHKSYDNISIGFSCNRNNGESLTAGKLLQFLNADQNKDNDTAVLFIPYEISGDYQNTVLNEFLESLPA